MLYSNRSELALATRLTCLLIRSKTKDVQDRPQPSADLLPNGYAVQARPRPSRAVVTEGGLGWGTLWGSAALLGLLVFLIAYQSYENLRHPLAPLPYPLNRRTNQPQTPTAR